MTLNKVSKTNNKKEKKFSFKMPSAIVILITILFVLVALSWILSWSGMTYKDKDDITQPVSALGIFGTGIAIGEGFKSGVDLIFYLFVLGAVIELMLVSGSMEAGIAGLVKGFKGKELFLIPILVMLFSAGGAIYGMSEETIALFVIVVPALSFAGFDTIVGMMVILGGTATGNAMSIVNPFNLGAATSAINDSLDIGVDYNQGITLFITLVWWLILTSISMIFITGYAWYVKKSPEKSFNKQMKKESDEWLKEFGSGSNEIKANGPQRISLGLFMTAFILMILLFIPWHDLIGLDYSTGTKDPIFGLIAPLGKWYFNELSMLFIFVGAIIAIILKKNIEQRGSKVSSTLWSGAKEMFSIGILIGIARGIPYILETTGMQTAIVGGMISSMKEMKPIEFLYVSFFIMLVLSTLITSTSGLASASMGLFSTAIFGANPGTDLGIHDAINTGLAGAWGFNVSQSMSFMGSIVIVYMMAIGIMNFFVPSNPIVMASMSQSKVAYGDGVKLMMPLASIMLLITLAGVIPSIALIL